MAPGWFVADVAPAARAYPDTIESGFERWLVSKDGQEKASTKEFASNAKFWCGAQESTTEAALRELKAEGAIFGRKAARQ